MKVKSLFLVFLLSVSSFSFASVYKSSAEASYYAEKYHGRKTASGESFNMYAMTCAHKTLPFGTLLRVTNLSNNKSVDVRVNDRGPFVKGREIDVSKAAAQKLGMIKSGTARVRIEIIDKKESEAQALAKSNGKISGVKSLVLSQPQSAPGTFWDIQVASFSNYENANKLAQALLKNGFENVYFQKTSSVTRVVLKKIPDSSRKSVEDKLLEKGHTGFLVKKSI